MSCITAYAHSTYDSFSVKIVKFEEWHTYPSWTVNMCPMRCACEYVLYDNDEINRNMEYGISSITISIIIFNYDIVIVKLF